MQEIFSLLYLSSPHSDSADRRLRFFIARARCLAIAMAAAAVHPVSPVAAAAAAVGLRKQRLV